MKGKILIFTDLEGTLLREEDGQYDEEEMFRFLSQISRLEKLEDATAEMHIVSPMYEDQMQRVLKRLDETFKAYNKRTGENVSCVESAIAFPWEGADLGYRNNQDRITLMKFKNPISYGTEKANYVEGFIDAYRNAKRFIYMGNGRNDILAMRKIREHNGVVICPSNCVAEAKALANYKSDKEDLSGITEGFSKLCGEIEQSRLHSENNADSKTFKPTQHAHTDPDEEER